jgi:hypothetical protein
MIYLLNAVGKVDRDRELEVNFQMLKKQLSKPELDNLLIVMRRVYKKTGRQDFKSLITNSDQLDILRPSTGRSSEHDDPELMADNTLQLRTQKIVIEDNNILGALLDNQRNGLYINQDSDQEIWQKLISDYMEYLQTRSQK